MIITDLNYLEVTEETNIEGSGGYSKPCYKPCYQPKFASAVASSEAIAMGNFTSTLSYTSAIADATLGLSASTSYGSASAAS